MKTRHIWYCLAQIPVVLTKNISDLDYRSARELAKKVVTGDIDEERAREYGILTSGDATVTCWDVAIPEEG